MVLTSINNDKKRYLIYKGTGGLAHNLSGLCWAIKLCELQDRNLIIDMKHHPAFKLNFSDIFIIKDLNISYQDTYENIDLNTIYKNKTIMDVANSGIRFYEGEYYLLGELISTKDKNIVDDIVVHAGFINYGHYYKIQINDDIVKKILCEELIQEPYISAHFRNTDKKNDIHVFIENIKKVYLNTNIKSLYLATDDYNFFHVISQEITDLKIYRNTFPEEGIANIHYSNKDKFLEIYDCIRDVYYVSQSNYFIPSYNSGLSKLMMNQINQIFPIIPNIPSMTKII
jgi:hypothetical protein